MHASVLRGDTVVRTSPCAAFITGVKGCGKTKGAFQFFSKAISKKFGQKATQLEESREGNTKCLLFYRLILAGETEKLFWMNFNSEDTTAMFLLSYFVDHCKVRNCHLDFISEPLADNPDSLEKMVYKMHNKIRKLWNKFTDDQKRVFSRQQYSHYLQLERSC